MNHIHIKVAVRKLTIYLSIYLSVWLSVIHLAVYLSIYLSIYLFTYVSICLYLIYNYARITHLCIKFGKFDLCKKTV
jgi:hypothetical protein